jgi:hypothetical protein
LELIRKIIGEHASMNEYLGGGILHSDHEKAGIKLLEEIK